MKSACVGVLSIIRAVTSLFLNLRRSVCVGVC